MEALRIELADELGVDGGSLENCPGAAWDLYEALQRLESWALRRLHAMEMAALQNNGLNCSKANQ
jgi:hypothetical protein